MNKRTPLHVACAEEADSEVVVYLTEEHAESVVIKDKEGLTPLHLSCSAEQPCLEAVAAMSEACPEACVALCSMGKTPLHKAIENGCSLLIIKELIWNNAKSLRIPDDRGRIPLHQAVFHKADVKILKVLVKKFPKGCLVVNKQGETAYSVAKLLGLSEETLQLLDPTDKKGMAKGKYEGREGVLSGGTPP
jgi:ankyrin repeat protein